MRILVCVLFFAVFTGSASAFELKGITLGEKTSTAQIESAMGVKCDVGANEMQVCNGQTTIGGVPGVANIVVSPQGILQRIHFSFDADSFEELAEAFVGKYGAHTTRNDIVQNGFGAKFESPSKAWTLKNGNRIDLSKNAATLGKGFIAYSTPADRARLNGARKANRGDL